MLLVCDGGAGRVVEDADPDTAALRREFHRISDEVREDDLDSMGIAVPLSVLTLGFEHELDFLGLCSRHGVLDDPPGELAGIERHDAETQPARFESGQIEEVVDHA